MIRRLLAMIPTLFFASVIVFATIRMIPGDIIDMMISQNHISAGGTDREQLEKALGLDQPMYIQYFRWMNGILLRGDCGSSLWQEQSVIGEILARLPTTFQLGAMVDGLLFTLNRGETLGLVGESCSGKSNTGLAILRMLDITGGRIVFDGEDITGHGRAAMQPIRKRMQMVYQYPFGSLNPRMKVVDLIAEPMIVHNLLPSAKARADRARELLSLVGLRSDMADRYIHEFSGGQRQRIGVGRALSMEPELLICDEPVSALDVSIQAQIVNLFQDLQQSLGLTYVFVAHDLAVVRHISDRIAVMYLGRIVEIADRETLYNRPLHPYTKALLAAVAIPDPEIEATRPQIAVTGEVPSALRPPPGCRFHTRCPRATDLCKTEEPQLRDLSAGQLVSCHHV